MKEDYQSDEIKIFRDLLDSTYIMKEMVDFSSKEIMTSILTVLAKYSETGEEFFSILNGNPQPDVSQLIWQFLSVKQAQIRIQALFKYTTIHTVSTVQSISSLGKVPIEILPGKRRITWVLVVLHFAAEFQMEPLAPSVIYY